MKNIKRKMVFVGIVFFSFFLASNMVVGEAIIDNVTFNPSSPAPLSKVTVTGEISGLGESDIVHLIVKECDANTGVCDDPSNLTMVKADDSNNFSIEVTLGFDSATYFDYWFEIFSDGNWTKYEDDTYVVQLDLESDNGTPTNGGSDDGDGTPGFELIFLLIAISLSIMILKRKRLK